MKEAGSCPAHNQTLHDAIWVLFHLFGSGLGYDSFLPVLDFPNVFRCRQFIVKILQHYDFHGYTSETQYLVYYHGDNGFYFADGDDHYKLDKNGFFLKQTLCFALPNHVLCNASHFFHNYFNALMIEKICSDEWKMIGFNMMERELTRDIKTFCESLWCEMDEGYIQGWKEDV
jgi:hypothetical protein